MLGVSLDESKVFWNEVVRVVLEYCEYPEKH